ncbi:hypothetical protein PUN28_018970 [Cardiocondyla obscurior]
MSFEFIFEKLPPSITDVQKLQETDVAPIENVKKFLPASFRDEEYVPPILKPSAKTAMNVLSDENAISGQESMEAFMNMSQSKGIDSFINLDEPEFNDLLMNVSQPSVLFTSVISSNDSLFIKNDTLSVKNKNVAQNDVEDSSNFNDINSTYIMKSTDNTITLNETHRTNTPSKEPRLDKSLNETYNRFSNGAPGSSRSSLDKGETVALSSTFVAEPNADATFVQSQNTASNDVQSLDITYVSSTKDAKRSISPMFINDVYVPTMHVDKIDLNVTCDVPTHEIKSVDALTCETLEEEKTLNISFKAPICNQSTPLNPNKLNETSNIATNTLNQSEPPVYSMLKAPTSLRQELLAEVQRSGEHKLDSTYNHIPSEHLDLKDVKENIHRAYNKNETDVCSTNRFHTYRKTAFTSSTNQHINRNKTIVIAQKELSMDQRKFYTFTKKSNHERNDSTACENVEKGPHMNNTFSKSVLSKALPNQNTLRTLSKLPQFLQKSNPNLVSNSLKSVGGIPISRMSSIGYIKGSQPNIMQNIAEKSQLSSGLLPYGKIKSGSEQLLPEANVNTSNQFPMKGVIAGSTESIESAHSVHSAPDLDDRLSTCSDSSNSHNSCTKTMNIEQLHKLVRMQEESLQQDLAPKPNRQVLENTWVEAKTDLPSPILKNGVESCKISKPLLGHDLSMKCSSPLISPTGSSHALNSNGRNAEGNTAKAKDEIVVSEKTEDLSKVVPKIENKTRLKQPTNWNTGNKPAAVISGIPRPTSRIPAPRFVRPNTKANQSDLKKE